MMTYEYLIDRITNWADTTSDVRAALILGSRARKDHPADDWSDLDILVFACNPDQFVLSSTWATTLAPAWLTFIERTGDGKSWERRTLYEGGLDVDVALNPVEALDSILQGIPADVADIIRRGVKILVDKDGQLAQIMKMQLPESTLFQKPTESEFINVVSDFWYHTLWSAKHLRRGELWWAKGGVDVHIKELLQRMLEWHAHAQKGDQFDTWLRGRFLEEWAAPRALAQLPDIFAHYNRHDIARALLATMDLFTWLEDETSIQWGYTCPKAGETQAAAVTKGLIAEMR